MELKFTLWQRVFRRPRRQPPLQPLPDDWAVQVRQIHLWARGGQWLRYRDGRAAMADILMRRGHADEALEQWLDVWFVDLNGPRNALPPSEALLLTEAPALEPGMGVTQPRVRKQVRRLMVQLQLEPDDLQAIFFAVASTTYRRYTLPISPSRAWLVIGAQLLD